MWLTAGKSGAHDTKLWHSYVAAVNNPENLQAHQGAPNDIDDNEHRSMNNFIPAVDLCWDLQELETVVGVREGLKDAREAMAAQAEAEQGQSG